MTSSRKLRVITHPEQPNMPMQRINIDICAIPSYEPKPMMLRNNYGVDMGTSGLILQAESREKILANKLVALALRPNRIKNRDLWDIVWLRQQAGELPLSLVIKKVADHRQERDHFVDLLEGRIHQLRDDASLQSSFVGKCGGFCHLRLLSERWRVGRFGSICVGLFYRRGSGFYGILVVRGCGSGF